MSLVVHFSNVYLLCEILRCRSELGLGRMYLLAIYWTYRYTYILNNLMVRYYDALAGRSYRSHSLRLASLISAYLSTSSYQE
jgi:hypothetical protein